MSEDPPVGPTSRAQPDVADEPEAPPPPPHELTTPAPVEERQFEAEGQSWIARIAGKGSPGTGSYGLGMIDAVHFFAAAAPDKPLREALLARNRFRALFDDELVDLLARATPIVLPEDS